MKRLLSLTAALWLLLALLPCSVGARTIHVQASYLDGTLSLSWKDAGEVLKDIGDSTGKRYTPQSSAPGSAQFSLSLPAGTHPFTAYFESGYYADFSVSVEPVSPGFTVDELLWDNAAKTLTVGWHADTPVTVLTLTVGGTDYPVYTSDSPITLTLDMLSPGSHIVYYSFEALGETHMLEDSEHCFLYTGETVSTFLTLTEENGEVIVCVTDAFDRPVAGATVRMEVGSTEWIPQTTDENGIVRLSAALSEVTRVWTEDLEKDGVVYTGSVYETTVQTTAPSRTEPPNQDVVASTASTRRTTTKPRTSATTAATTAASGISTHVGPKTTGAEQDLIALNVVSDEKLLQAFQLTGEKLDSDARLLVSQPLYKALVSGSRPVPMLSMLSDAHSFSAAQAKELIRQELAEFDSSSIRTQTMDLGILYWDEKAGEGTPLAALPEGEYIIRLPRPASMADCNHFYVVALSDESVGEPIEAIVEPEYIQFTLSELGSFALFACESDRSEAGLYVHPIAYVFFAIGGSLLILGAVMIYFFFIRREPAAASASPIDAPAETDSLSSGTDSSGSVSLDSLLRHSSDEDEP